MCSFQPHSRIFFCRILGNPENQSRTSLLLETLTPKSPPPSILNFLVFWLSLDTMSLVRRREKLRPKLDFVGCLSLLWRRRSRGTRHRSRSSTTLPRIGTKNGVCVKVLMRDLLVGLSICLHKFYLNH